MTDLRKAAEMALEALEGALSDDKPYIKKSVEAIGFLRQALAQPEQEHFCDTHCTWRDHHPDCKLAQPEQDDDAYEYAKRLAECIWEKYYKEESPHWRPCHDVLGVLTQIDNMTCGLEKAQPEQEPVANEVQLNIIRWWPDGFANQLEHVWKDLIGFIPNYKLLDLQRLLAEFGFTMKIYEGEAPTISEPVKGDISEPVENLEPVACECHSCIKENDLRDGVFPLSATKMILCPECGNKRCPKASNHIFACTGSNESGQLGSIYTAPPKRELDTNEVCKKLCAQARRSERGACHQIVWDYGFSRIDNEEVQAACIDLAQAIRGRGKHE